MGARVVTPQEAVNRFLDEALNILHKEIMRSLQYLCEESVKRVRDRDELDSWYDHTGNLRSSVGYGIYSYGEQLMESAFESVKGGEEGSREGRKFIGELSSQYRDTYNAVLVAAMTYAEYVERCKNKDVLASTELYIRGKVDGYVTKAVEKAVSEINKLKA